VILRTLLALLLLLVTAGVRADDMMMVRSSLAFEEAMLALQHAIVEHGYTVSRVQRVDIGLTASGYQTDKYRIVFLGKLDEVRELTARYPQLIPYLPIKVTIFAEGEETLVATFDPSLFRELVPDSEARFLFMRWKNDLHSILEDVRLGK